MSTEARSAPQVHRGQARWARKKAEHTRGASAQLQQAPPRRAARPLAHPYSCLAMRKKVNKENGQKGAEEAHGEAAGRFGEGEGTFYR